jgi:integrase
MEELRHNGMVFKLYPTAEGTWVAYVRFSGRSVNLHRKDKKTAIEAAKSFADGKTFVRPEKTVIDRKTADYLFEAQKVLEPYGINVLEAAQYYARHNVGLTKKITVHEAVNQFLAHKIEIGNSDAYVKALKNSMRKLSNELGTTQLHLVTADDLNALMKKTKGSPRHRNNVRNYTLTLFNWARKRGMLADRATVAEKMDLFREPPTEISILSPENLKQLLSLAYAEKDEIAICYFAFGAFTGIRLAELERLNWSDILLHENQIEIAAHKAKTATRRLVPIPENLKKWIKVIKDKEGKVLKARSCRHTLPLAQKVMGSWPANCLRHSFISYRLTEIQNVAQVALEAGNSPNKIFTNYRQIRLPDRRLVTQELAKKWFSIVPTKS